ncbi:hypothetical protein H9P43_008791 [Blastocladiella emersonii ATCC 22665]|nr:hypothetical protein H9P43_008791 [Blastocladiella emersonii ATCC 22665]
MRVDLATQRFYKFVPAELDGFAAPEVSALEFLTVLALLEWNPAVLNVLGRRALAVNVAECVNMACVNATQPIPLERQGTPGELAVRVGRTLKWLRDAYK